MAQQYEQRDNAGTLFKNNRKEKETHPDYTGTCMIEGKVMRMSAWIKEGKSGKFMSFAFNEPFIKDENKSVQAQGYIKNDLPLNEYPEDEIPF